MTRGLTDHERALIDAAVARGQVQRVPQGQSGQPRIQWDGAKLVYVEKQPVRSISFGRGPKPCPKVAARRRRVAEMIDQGMTAAEVALNLTIHESMARQDAAKIGKRFARAKRKANTEKTPRERLFDLWMRKGVTDAALHKREVTAAKKRAKVKAGRDRRRFKAVPVATGKVSALAPQSATGTIFPNSVRKPLASDSVFKDGAMNSKIGGDVLVGWLAGARIVTLTLEERATCPATCAMWSACYGNNMSKGVVRWLHGPELEAKIAAEIPALIEDHGKVLVRLHVLGDFYSPEYVALWDSLLREHPGLAVFGFTAHLPGTEMGDLIAAVRAVHGRRFSLRHSGYMDDWGSFVFPHEPLEDVKQIGKALVCPEQREGLWTPETKRHCGNCAACWSSDVPVAFSQH